MLMFYVEKAKTLHVQWFLYSSLFFALSLIAWSVILNGEDQEASPLDLWDDQSYSNTDIDWI